MRPTHWDWRAGGIWDKQALCGPPAVPAAWLPTLDLSGPDSTELPQLGTGWMTIPPENTDCWLLFYHHYIPDMHTPPVFMLIPHSKKLGLILSKQLKWKWYSVLKHIMISTYATCVLNNFRRTIFRKNITFHWTCDKGPSVRSWCKVRFKLIPKEYLRFLSQLLLSQTKIRNQTTTASWKVICIPLWAMMSFLTQTTLFFYILYLHY